MVRKFGSVRHQRPIWARACSLFLMFEINRTTSDVCCIARWYHVLAKFSGRRRIVNMSFVVVRLLVVDR
jgi:hypothetical protein